MKSKVKNLSTLIDTQLPNFILSEYPNFSAFLQKYYEELELDGHPVDLINNLTKYRDIDTYEQKILNQRTTLSSSVSTLDDVIFVEDTSSFPEFNGYILIGDEAIFYKYKTEDSFVDCYRNVSAATKLGDLYSELEFNNVSYSNSGNGKNHASGLVVYNLSNLFLYALAKNFESEYLGPFPENLLKKDINRSLLVKNIKKFYASKGTKQSIQFVFNSVISQSNDDIPDVYYPKDQTIKASNGQWLSKYSLKARLISGDPQKIIGSEISEYNKDGIRIASAIIDNISMISENFYEIIFADGIVNGKFSIAAKTRLTKDLSFEAQENSRIYVESTSGFENDSILIKDEIISIKSKNVNQFIIKERGSIPLSSDVNEDVFECKIINVKELENPSNEVKLIIFGAVTKLNAENAAPYSSSGDAVLEITDTTKDRIVFDSFNDTYRWFINQSLTSPNFNNSTINDQVSEVISNVSALYEDNQYFYITGSGYPSYNLGKANWNVSPFADARLLRLIPKNTRLSTEIFETPAKDVGIFVNGVLAYGYKDEEQIKYGEVVSIQITNKGRGYTNPPYVLIEDFENTSGAKAGSILSGEVVNEIVISDPGSNYEVDPKVTITSGRNAQVSAVVTLGRVTSLKIVNPGEYYSTPPEIRIYDSKGNGRFAKFNSIIDNGKLVGFEKIDEGKFYTQENVVVEVIPVGSGAEAVANIKTWRKNRFNKYSNIIDTNNGIYYKNQSEEYNYAHVGNPSALRNQLNDDGTTHSPIIGYAYDGNPIYGPYGFSNPSDSGSSVTRMTSSYTLSSSRNNGPSKNTYPLGSFTEDYTYNHRSGSLDENNGRFCVTPEYPEGTYAYFLTIDQEDKPVFPYILGKNYYSLPIETNYNTDLTQNLLPKTVSRLRIGQFSRNGANEKFVISEVYPGKIDGVDVYDSPETFSVGANVYNDNPNIVSKVSEIQGKSVVSIENRQVQALKISTKNPCYLFSGDTITQPETSSSGELIGDVFDSQVLVLRNVSGNFDKQYPIQSSINVITTILNKESSFTKDSIIKLVNGKKSIVKSVSSNKINVSVNPFVENETITFTNGFSEVESNKIYYVVDRKTKSFKISETPGGTPLTLTSTTSVNSVAEGEKARGIVLESVTETNNVRIKVTDGNFAIDDDYYLLSSTSTDTKSAKIISIISLGTDIEIDSLNDNIGLVTTSENHGLSEGDIVDIDIIPNDNTTETTYYVRRRLYQKLKVNSPNYTSFLNDLGVGRFVVLNNGSYRDTAGSITGDYANGLSQTYTNVELIFLNQNKTRNSLGKPGDSKNAKATIIVTNGIVTSINITNKGSGYIKGDLLTVTNESIEKIPGSVNSNYLTLEVDHVGLSNTETIVNVGSSKGLSNNDLITIGNEILKVTNIISSKKIQVLRAQNNTTAVDHFNTSTISLTSPAFKLTTGYNPQDQDFSFIVESYDSNSGELLISYDAGVNLNNAIRVSSGSRFLDQNVPQKSFQISEILSDLLYCFEFSKDQVTWSKNPVLDIKNNYKYKFDLSNSTLKNSFFEVSPCINYNIYTNESKSSDILPGNSGSYYSVKFGYGNNITSNNFTQKQPLLYNVYYYFDKSGNTNTDNAYLKIISDPLQGKKIVTYVTESRFVYDLSEETDYDGSGVISYNTSSLTAEGKIKSISILSNDDGLKELPVVLGVLPSSNKECIATANLLDGKIISTNIISTGNNYSKPKIYVSDSSGYGAEFEAVSNQNGEILQIVVKNFGKNYSNPILKVIESDLEVYYYSNDLGKPKTIQINSNGYYFNSDSTLKTKYKSLITLSVKNINNLKFLNNQYVYQYKNGNLIASGKVVPNYHKTQSNIVKLYDVQGNFEENLEITGEANTETAVINKIFVSVFDSVLEASFNTSGKYYSDRSHLNNKDQRIADSYFYQDYSYVIKSKTPISVWRKVITDTVHPAGFKVFGDLLIESKQKLPEAEVPRSVHTSFIQLWNDTDHRITVEKVTKTNTVSIVTLTNTQEQRGKGYIAAPYLDSGDTTTYDLELYPEFDGYYNESGNREGTTTFTMRVRGSTQPFSVSNKNNLVITLDGVLQNSDTSFTVNGSQITFTQAPLGYRDISGNSILPQNYISGVDVPEQNFVGRYIAAKNSFDNSKLFRKIKDVSEEFDGVTREFDLYYEDNSPCSLENKENLLVSIDGILQRAGETPLFPYDRSYYILRTTTPNKIVFNEAPKENTKFSAYSIGNYYRVTISKEITEENSKVFPLKTQIDNRTFVVDNERNLFVFIDGVLQTRNKSYTLTNNFIKFKESLVPGQSIYMLFCYGGDSDRTLTTFDYSDQLFDKIYTLRVNSIVFNTYQRRNNLFGKYVYSLDDDNLPLWSTAARILSTKKVSQDIWDIVVRSRTNQTVDLTRSLEIPGVGGLPSFALISITDYERDITGYPLLNSYAGQTYQYLEKGDLIKIDGENAYREVKSSIDNPLEYDNLTYFSKFRTSNNNDIIPGVTLSAEPVIEDGSVVNIVWSGEKMSNYLTGKNSTFVGKVKLIFVPQPVLNEGGQIVSLPQGGGASGYVYFNENKVVNTVITNPGEGYIVPPKIYIALGYNIIKSNQNVVKRQINSIIPSISTESFATLNAFPADITFRYRGQELEGYFFVEAFILNDINKINSEVKIFENSFAKFSNYTGLSRIQNQLYPYLPVNYIFPHQVKLDRFFGGSKDTVPVVSPNQEDSKNIVTVYTVSLLDNIRVEAGEIVTFAAAYIQIEFGTEDTILYVGDTAKFTDSGYLLLETEIIYYESKLSDRFIVTERGSFNSPITYHAAGAYVRQYKPDLADIGTDTDIKILVGESYINLESPTVIDIQPLEIGIISKGDASYISGSGSEIRLERDATIIDAGQTNVIDLQEINKSLTTDILVSGVVSITQEPSLISVGGRLGDVAIDPAVVFGGIIGALSVVDQDLTSSIVPQTVLANVTISQEIINGIIPDTLISGVADITLQPTIVSVGGRLSDVALAPEEVFGGVVYASSVVDQDLTSSIIPQTVLSDVITIQEITVTPPVDSVVATTIDVIYEPTIVSVGGRLDDVAVDPAVVFGGIIGALSVVDQDLTSSIIPQTVLANVASIQEITVTPPIDSAVVTVESITTVSTNADSEGEVVFIQTDSYTAYETGIALSVDVFASIDPIIVPKIFVDTTGITEINIQQQLVLDEGSVVNITPNEVVANDINNIQIYRTIETGLGENGTGVPVLGEYPYQSELMSASIQNVFAEVGLVYELDLQIDITSIKQVTIIPPAQETNVISVSIANVESIIVTTSIDDPLIDNVIPYQPEITVGLININSTTSDTVIQTSIDSKIFIDVSAASQVIGFYESLRTTQTTLDQDPEALTSPVSIFADDVVSNIDKPITNAYVPIEPQASVTIASSDIKITNTVNAVPVVYDISVLSVNPLLIGISPNITPTVQAIDAAIITTIIDKTFDNVASAPISVSQEITVSRSTGVLDYYQESLYVNKDIVTRSDGTVTVESYNIITRNDGTIFARNIEERMQFNAYGTYGVGTMMTSYGTLESSLFFDNTGVQGTTVNTTFNEVDVARIEIEEYTRMYPSLTIEDFDVRRNSNISKSGETLNLGISAYTTSDVGSANVIEDHKISEI